MRNPKNPRVGVTLSPHQYELVSRLSRVQGRSRAAIVLEYFEAITPVLERLCVVAEAAEMAQTQAKEGLQGSLERAEAAMAPHVAQAMGQFDLLVEDAIRGLGGAPAAVAGGTPAAAPTPPPPPVAVTTGVRSPTKRGKRRAPPRLSASSRRKK